MNLNTAEDRNTLFLNLLEKAASASLLDEVSATPKPGLVDLHDSGAHTDMDFHTFKDSARAIVPYIRTIASIGTAWRGKEEALFQAIRPIGAEAEQAMFAATKGINTHKGMIFSMGIVSAAAGFLFSKNLVSKESRQTSILTAMQILGMCRKMCRRPLEADFAAISPAEPKTHGERLYLSYGCRGIRGEAADGFPAVRNHGLPALKESLFCCSPAEQEALISYCEECAPPNLKELWNKIRLQTLLNLMANVEDTNVLFRTDYKSLLYAKQAAASVLSLGGGFTNQGMDALVALNKDFTSRNISPGGCADLLAITIFLWRLEGLNFL